MSRRIVLTVSAFGPDRAYQKVIQTRDFSFVSYQCTQYCPMVLLLLLYAYRYKYVRLGGWLKQAHRWMVPGPFRGSSPGPPPPQGGSVPLDQSDNIVGVFLRN